MSSGVKQFSFDSVGERMPQLRNNELTFQKTTRKRTVNYSPKLPLQMSTREGELFVMNTEVKDAYANNLQMILKTNRGERVMEPDFGANLRAILSEYGSPGFEEEVMVRIRTACRFYMPTVSLSTMKMELLPSNPADGMIIVKFDIGYSYPACFGPQSVSVILSTIS